MVPKAYRFPLVRTTATMLCKTHTTVAGQGHYNDGWATPLIMTVRFCLFWANQGTFAGGGIRIGNSWPLQVVLEDSQFLDNIGFLCHAWQWGLVPSSAPADLVGGHEPEQIASGVSYFDTTRVYVSQLGRLDNGGGLAPILFIVTAAVQSQAGTVFNIMQVDLVGEDIRTLFHPFFALSSSTQNVDNPNLGVWNVYFIRGQVTNCRGIM